MNFDLSSVRFFPHVKDLDGYLMDYVTGKHTQNGALEVDIGLYPIFPYIVNNLVFTYGQKISRQVGYFERASIGSRTLKSMLFII